MIPSLVIKVNLSPRIGCCLVFFEFLVLGAFRWYFPMSAGFFPVSDFDKVDTVSKRAPNRKDDGRQAIGYQELQNSVI